MITKCLRRYYSQNMIKRYKVKDIFKEKPSKTSAVVQGWIRSVRKHKNRCFVDINDGSSLDCLQVVMRPEIFKNGMSYGASIKAVGEIVETNLNKAKVEMHCVEAKLIGTCDDTFPFLKHAGHDVQYTRTFPHLRMREDEMAGVLRVRNSLEMQFHRYFQDNGFLHVHTPVLTSSDCEGAGEMFSVTSNKTIETFDEDSHNESDVDRTNQNSKSDTVNDVTQDLNEYSDKPIAQSKALQTQPKSEAKSEFFGNPIYLTVSGQFHLEACALALGDVYTLNSAFRAETGTSKKHLSEFKMLEVELAFTKGLDDVIHLIQESTRSVLLDTYESCSRDIENFTINLPPEHQKAVLDAACKTYERITYHEAINLLQQNSKVLKTPAPHWGDDINSEHESFLTKHCGQLPVFVTDFPVESKPFYAFANPDEMTVAAVDLIFPFCGELCGGSVREHRLELLRNKIHRLGLGDSYDWYLDLRRYGNAPHAGYGLGFDRLIRFVLGINNIRDVVPFPRAVRSCLL
ncbi:asparaginyl-tRNA synthetase-like isoform X1 [Clavelina lepadiformis]|uniref:asparaginyl-tRNA synthetase-like isoform X1 n=2 Tax=Clavelina lepadiformis TaxID=159417 RepID=UPI004041FAD6